VKRLRLFLLFSLLLVPLSGCWDQNELDELAIVMGIGIDKSEDGDLIVTYQVVNPTEIAPGITGGGGGKQPPFTVYETKGKNLMEATRKASMQTSRRLFFAHARILLLSEKLAKENLYQALDMISRDPEVRSTIQVLISRKTTPSTLLRTFSAIDKISADEVAAELRLSEEVWGENLQQDINEVLQSILNEGGEPLINGLILEGDKALAASAKNYETGNPSRVRLSGMGVFKNGKLKGWLDGSEARGVLWIKGKLTSSAVAIPCKGKKNAVAIEIVRNKTNLSSDVTGNVPTIKMEIYPEANIAEANCPVNLEDENEIFEMEKVLNKVVKKEIYKSVKEAQKIKSDILGFGELLYRDHPKKWRKEIKRDYDEIFPQMKVEVKVDSRIRRAGMRTSPFLLDRKKEER
jgi:spore germination protein KC